MTPIYLNLSPHHILMYDLLAGILIGLVIALAAFLTILFYGRRSGVFELNIHPVDPVPKVDRQAIINLQEEVDKVKEALSAYGDGETIRKIDTRLATLEFELAPYLERARRPVEEKKE